MGAGSVLVIIAVALVIIAYVARPFVVASLVDDPDRTIERWVSWQRAQVGGRTDDGERFCTQCGHCATKDDRFCSRCGTALDRSGQ
ncbi:MAG: hypothetical protein GX620_04640 [Chloroflexi bacterium]|nr:hypothetical protein [Chloroflexota bacterium]